MKLTNGNIFARKKICARQLLTILFIVTSCKFANATAISYTNLFIDDWVNNSFPLFSGSSLNLHIEAGVYDPLGVPGNISSVSATHRSSGDHYHLPYAGFGNFTTPTFGPYFARVPLTSIPVASRRGQYSISVANDQGETTTAYTHSLRATQPLARARNFEITGSTLTPQVSWRNVPGADRYEFRVWDSTGRLIHDTPRVNSPFFEVPTGLLEPNANYALGIFSMDEDGSGNIERRSFEVKTYETVISPPTGGSELSKLDYATFARAAYRDNPQVLPAGYRRHDVKIESMGPLNDFAGSIYVNESENLVVIAVAGSDTVLDWIGPNPTFLRPSGRPTQAFREYVEAAASMLEEVRAEFPNADVSLTGHSLGGAIAQLVGDAAGLRVVSFNAPGAEQTINDSQLSQILGAIPSAPIEKDITNYRVYGDLVSTVGRQLGEEVTMAPPLSRFIVDAVPVGVTKTVHLIDTVFERIYSRADTLNERGPTILSVGQEALADLLDSDFFPDLVKYGVSATVLASSILWIDPGEFDGYMFEIEQGSPPLASIIFPFLLDVEAIFEFQILMNGEWLSIGFYQELEELIVADLKLGRFRFLVREFDTLLPIRNVEEFSFGLTFTEGGELNASLTAFSTIPEPMTIALFGLGLAGLGLVARKRSERRYPQPTPAPSQARG